MGLILVSNQKLRPQPALVDLWETISAFRDQFGVRARRFSHRESPRKGLCLVEIFQCGMQGLRAGERGIEGLVPFLG